MPQPVHRCRRPMRDDALLSGTCPCRDAGRELKPCGAEVKVVRDGRDDQSVDTCRHPVEATARSSQALQRRGADPCLPGLLSRDKTPLILGEFLEPEQCWLSLHYFIIPLARGIMKHRVKEPHPGAVSPAVPRRAKLRANVSRSQAASGVVRRLSCQFRAT